MSGQLFIVGTPLGNLEDITLRALRTLKEVALIAAEDTRVTRKLLARYDIITPLISFHQHSSPVQMQKIISILQEGKDVALVTDAGMPGISDPGELLVRECLSQDLKVIAIPGPSAATTALAISGLSTGEFIFVGFLPRRRAERRRALAELVGQPRTLVFFEAPHRLLAALADLRQVLGNRRAVAARELTKKFEQVVRGRLEEIERHFSATPPRGEITLVIEGTPKEDLSKAQPEGEALSEAVVAARALMKKGMSAKDAAKEIAASASLSRRLLYNALQIKSNP